MTGAAELEPREPPAGRRELERWLGFARRTTHSWPLLPAALVLASAACALVLYTHRPAYRSETVLLYSQGVGSTDPAEQASQRNPATRLKELILSRRELSRIVSQFGLYPKTRQGYGMEDAVDELKRQIEFRAPGGDTFSIAYQGASPSEAQRVTAGLAKMMIDGDAALRKTQTEFVRSFLATEKASKADALRAAEQLLAVFMGEHRRFALDATPLAAGAAIRATLTATVPSQAAPARTGRDPRSSATNTVSSSSTARALSTGEDAGERGRALAALAAARLNLNEQLAHLTPAHPDVRAARGAVERATSRVEALGPEAPPATVAPVQPKLAEPPDLGRWAAASIRTVPALASAVAPDVVTLETEWFKLTRAVTEGRQRLDQVEAALFKADIQASSLRSGGGVQISVIDPAYLPQRPLGMSRTLIIASFLGFGLLLGLMLAVLRAAVDDRIYEARDVAPATFVLTQVPRFSGRGG